MIIAKTMADALQYITADQIEEAREAWAEDPGEQISWLVGSGMLRIEFLIITETGRKSRSFFDFSLKKYVLSLACYVFFIMLIAVTRGRTPEKTKKTPETAGRIKK